MVGDIQDEKKPATSGRDQRSFTRNAILLEGECLFPKQPAHAIEILDFCPGGVLVSFPEDQAQSLIVPVPGDIVEIRCTVPMARGQQSLVFQGRVARADSAGAGIAFINPSFDALHVLHEYAKNTLVEPGARKKKSPKKELPSGVADATNESLIKACSQLVEEYVESMTKSFLDRATKQFYDLAGEVLSIPDKNAYYAAYNILSKNGTLFSREFLVLAQNRLRQSPLVFNITMKGAQPAQASGELTLSLVDEDVFEDWVVFTDMARAAEIEHKERLYELERRLSVLLKQTINNENDPYGPSSISQLFQEALGILSLDRKAVAESCKLFKKVMCGQAGELYTKLNQNLIDGGVLPVLHPPGKSPKPVHAARPARAEPSLEADKSPQVQTRVEPVETVAGLGPSPVKPAGGFMQPSTPASPPPSPLMRPASPQTSVASGSAPSSSPGSTPSSAVSGALQPPSQDWYHLIQGLNNLQNQFAGSLSNSGVPLQGSGSVSSARSGRMPAVPPGQSNAPAGQAAEPIQFTTDELLSALSRIKPDAPGQVPGERFHQGFMNKLQSVLAVTSPSAATKVVPTRETKILEFGGNLFDSVLTDNLVADTVKPWLNQLSIPLIKMALRDDSLFYDQSHLARQLINRIAELELFGDVSRVENAVRKKVDGLLAEIADADQVTPELLQKILKEVGMLVHVQNKAFEGNVHDLRTHCESDEERVTSEAPAKTTALSKLLSGLSPLVGDAPPPQDSEALSEHRKQARRLKIGSWLLLQREGVKKRIQLAWVAKDMEKYVFVNVQGLREETLSQIELAQYLRSGEIEVLSEGDEQLVDRAQTTMLQKVHLHLLRDTTHDPLTGLINRRGFDKKLAESLSRVRKVGTPAMLCYFDLEQFNVVNQTFGYEEGNRALTEASRVIQQELDEKVVLARVGGDEFALLFENCGLEDALKITTRVKNDFQDYRFVSGEKSLSLSFSAGLVMIDPESVSSEALLQAAETSCRIARSKGTNYVQVYQADEASLVHHQNNVEWVSRIDDALDHNLFELRCQPIVSISGRNVAIHHSEVLLRVPDKEGKQMSPVDLIMAAENYRRMASVDRWVIEHAFRWLADRRHQTELGGLAINLSGASLNEEGLIDFVLEKARKLKIPMNKVCFEITETVGISHLSGASEFIRELKKQTDCTFSLDDFGSGQSSYAYLKNLPVDYLKIDGAFVEKIDENKFDFAVVKSITEIGHFMGKKIIAERVESEAVLKILREIGVDYAQGYYLGKPRNMKVLGS